jgi:serine/threonine protein kinase
MLDFEPYFCTFEECQTPFDISNSFDGLLDHMQSHLPLLHHLDAPDGEHKEYIETDFEDHFKSYGEVADDIMATMKETSRRKGAFLFEDCPFCGGYPDVLETRFPDPHTIEAQKELRKHIKQHMQEIALFLPPYRSDIFDEDDVKGSDATHRQSVHGEEVSGNPDDFIVFCDRKDCDCKLSKDDPADIVTNTLATKPQLDLPKEFWSDLFDGSSFYDRSSPSNTDLTNDECLYSFVVLFVAQRVNIDKGGWHEPFTELPTFYNDWTEFKDLDRTECSPLNFAITYRDNDIARHLIELGANFEARDMENRTPIMIAARYNNKYMVEFLGQRGAKLESRDQEGRTALSLAAAHGSHDTVESLLDMGADVDTQDSAGQTPLSLATKGQYIEVVEVLQACKSTNTRSGEIVKTADVQVTDEMTLESSQKEQGTDVVKGQSAIPSSISSEERLNAFFDVPDLRHAFSNYEIDEVAALLQQTGHLGYKIPRWYILLRSIDKLELLPQLSFEAHLCDEWFPVDEHHLPGGLEDEVKTSILRHQHIILAFPSDWENGPQRHFNTKGPKPFSVVRLLFAGPRGAVEEIQSMTSVQHYALNSIRRRKDLGLDGHRKESMSALVSEIGTMRGLQHEHLVRYVCSYTDEDTLGFVMSPVADCDLSSFLEDASVTKQIRPTLQKFFGCLANGVSYLHSHNLRHGLIEPRNILVRQSQVLLAGFEFCSYSLSNPETNTPEGLLNPRYSPPEASSSEPRSRKFDVWSLGCVFLEMLAALRSIRHEDLKSTYEKMGLHSRSFIYCDNVNLTRHLMRSWEASSLKAQEKVPYAWIESMLQVDAQVRPTAAEVFEKIIVEPSYCGNCCGPVVDGSDPASPVFDLTPMSRYLSDKDPFASPPEQYLIQAEDEKSDAGSLSSKPGVHIVPPLPDPFNISGLQAATPAMHNRTDSRVIRTRKLHLPGHIEKVFADEAEANRMNRSQLIAALRKGWDIELQPDTLNLSLRVFGSSDNPGSLDYAQFCNLESFINTVSVYSGLRRDYAVFKKMFNLPDECVQLLFKKFVNPETPQHSSAEGTLQACLSVRLLDEVFRNHQEDGTRYARIPFEAFLTTTVTIRNPLTYPGPILDDQSPEDDPIHTRVARIQARVAELTDHTEAVPPLSTPDTLSPLPTDFGPDPTPDQVSAAAVLDDQASRAGLGAVALRAYDAQTGSQLSFPKGATIKKLRIITTIWGSGRYNGRHGLLPLECVRVTREDEPPQQRSHSPIERPKAPPPVDQQVATALYDYDAARDDELTLVEGDAVTNIEFPHESWWTGSCNGFWGWFPANYVQLEDSSRGRRRRREVYRGM